MNEYKYDGPVLQFGTPIARRWKASTYAVSEKKAKSNLMFQYKQAHNMTRDSKISLPGKISII